MQEHVTLLPPDAPSPGSRRISSTLPPDLLEQVRGRVRLLALILLIGFAFDPFIYFLIWTIATLGGYPVVLGNLWFRVVDLSAVAASAGLWWVARTRKVSSAHLHTLGLIYVVAICFIIALTMFWQYYLDKGLLLPLTWVPAVVILFPLILPGPPRRMLVAAVLAGAMAPLALAVLDLSGRMPVDAEAYFNAITSSAFAAGFAYMGARVVYRLGREVAQAPGAVVSGQGSRAAAPISQGVVTPSGGDRWGKWVDGGSGSGVVGATSTLPILSEQPNRECW